MSFTFYDNGSSNGRDGATAMSWDSVSCGAVESLTQDFVFSGEFTEHNMCLSEYALFPGLELVNFPMCDTDVNNQTDVLSFDTSIPDSTLCPADLGRAGTSSDSGTEQSDSDIVVPLFPVSFDSSTIQLTELSAICWTGTDVTTSEPSVEMVSTNISSLVENKSVNSNSASGTALNCGLCTAVLSTRQDFVSHQLTNHGLHACYTCLQLFENGSQLVRHAARCKGPLVCPHLDCKATFALDCNRKRHINRKHLRSEARSCQVCGMLLSNAANLKVHMLLHESAERPNGGCPVVCLLCGAGFRQRSQLDLHLDAHHADVELAHEPRTHICPFNNCDKSYLHSVTLKRHLRNVHQKERFPCELCSASFCAAADLARHEAAVHRLGSQGGRPYRCHEPGCRAAFVRSEHLVSHVRVHRPDGAKNGRFQCTLCPIGYEKAFCSLGNLREHISKKHHKNDAAAINIAADFYDTLTNNVDIDLNEDELLWGTIFS